ncbi:MAG: hypothetical protein M5R36_15065 [Deltaproteobacteria bacterium]|nr:hypothetical protein [Deltaproteobacteria bacterium]
MMARPARSVENRWGLLLNLLLAPVVFYFFHMAFVQDRYLPSFLVFAMPLAVMAVAASRRWSFGPVRPGWRTYLVMSGFPIAALFLFFALLNHPRLVKPFLAVLVLSVVLPLIEGDWRRYPRRVGPFVAGGLLVFCAVVFAVVPTSRVFELQLFGERFRKPIERILAQPGVTPLVTVTEAEKVDDYPRPPGTKIVGYFGRHGEAVRDFDPYMIEWRAPNLLYVSYERRMRFERLDLDKKKLRVVGDSGCGVNVFLRRTSSARRLYRKLYVD